MGKVSTLSMWLLLIGLLCILKHQYDGRHMHLQYSISICMHCKLFIIIVSEYCTSIPYNYSNGIYVIVYSKKTVCRPNLSLFCYILGLHRPYMYVLLFIITGIYSQH